MVIGVTGKYGAGKDAVTRILVAKGFTEINVDAIGHRVLQQNKDKVVDAFGANILDPCGMIDRKILGSIIFRDPKQRKLLESILHPLMRQEVQMRLEATWGHSVINAALLFPMGLDRYVGKLFIVRAFFLTRLFRAKKRDVIGFWPLLHRLSSQTKIIPKKCAINVDTYYIENTVSLQQLSVRVEKILQRLMKKEGSS